MQGRRSHPMSGQRASTGSGHRRAVASNPKERYLTLANYYQQAELRQIRERV